MIFLGAGASKPYGIPTLEEFSKYVFEKLEQIGHEEVLKNIRESLREFDMTLDFESLYSILEGLANPVRSVQYAGPLTAYLVKNKDNLPIAYDYSGVLRDLRKMIYDKCSIDRDQLEKVSNCMDRLLEVTEKNSCVERVVGGTGRQAVNIGRVFATTNYDMALELYFLGKEIPVVDGYEDTGAITKYFDPNILSNPYASGGRVVIKLHGSIWQFLRGSQRIKTKLDPYSDAIPFEIEVEKEMMIYPTREKDILNYQFFPFFGIFKRIRWTKLLVIGYSFRDEPINTAIIENMELNEKSQLIVINPKPDEVLENLYNNIPEDTKWRIPEHRVYKCVGKFGSPEVFEYLKTIERVSCEQKPLK